MMKREDLLELTRRMTPKRNCFTRTAGAYLTPQGEIDGIEYSLVSLDKLQAAPLMIR